MVVEVGLDYGRLCRLLQGLEMGKPLSSFEVRSNTN